jgi:hypothetical protein
MVYRLGRRNRYYKFRRLPWRQYTKLCAVCLSAILLVSIATMKFAPHTITQALGLSKKPSSTHKASTTAAKSVAVHNTGSSKPAPKSIAPAITAAAPESNQIQEEGCDVFPPMHPNLINSSAPELRKLAQYEQACNGAVAQRSSFFTPTPSTTAQAQQSATEVAAKLKAYAAADIAPLIFMEPDDLNGTNLDLSQYASGTYDAALNTYFQTLQSAGITSQMMGMWVYLPEGNLPVWSTTDPNTFAAVVTKTAQFQKQYFPGSQTSLMLDSESYAVGAGWGDGSYVSLVPYVQNIPKGLIDSFGLQGFPWAAPANQPSEGSLYNPQVYLRTDLAMQAAKTLGVTSIWLNTGTFNTMYAGQSGQTVTDSPAQRQQMLEGVIQLAASTKASGFSVSIHLFAQNKASLSEATDWSYWTTPGDGPNTVVFTTFAHDATADGIPIWIYDTY